MNTCVFAKRWDGGSGGSASSWLGAGLLRSPGPVPVPSWALAVRGVSCSNIPDLGSVFCSGLDFVFKNFGSRKKWVMGIAETCVAAEGGSAAKSPLDGFWWPLMWQRRNEAQKINEHKGAGRELDKSPRSGSIPVRENSVNTRTECGALSVSSPHLAVLKLDPCLSNFSRLEFSSAGSPPSPLGWWDGWPQKTLLLRW